MYVKIEKNPNGSHEFQSGGALQNGWAVIPSYVELPATFPFVDIEVEEVTIPGIDGIDITRLEVTSMTAREVIEEQIVIEPSIDEILNTLLGV